MLKLVSPIENGRWSFLDGYHIFDFDVVLLSRDDVRKYKLIDGNGDEIDVNIEECLKEER